MRFNTQALTCIALAGAAAAAPSSTSDLTFTSTNSLTSWLSSSIQTVLAPIFGGVTKEVSVATSLASYEASDKSIYDVITTNEHFTKLAKAVNYSSDSTKDLLKGKTGVPLTIFAPVNWEDPHHEGQLMASLEGPHSAALMQATNSWAVVSKHIDDYETAVASLSSSDDDKERRRRRLAYFIDAVLAYHLVDADKETISSTQLAQNSTVGTKLSIDGKIAEYIGKLNDGLPLRIRVGKSLLPKPGVYLNFYSRVVYPDAKLSNGVLHAVSYPLAQFPSILQGLYWSEPQFSTLTTAFLKTGSEGYLALPVAKRPSHKTNDDDEHHHHHNQSLRYGLSDPKGTTASTLFAPSNAAWDRLPWGFRAFLFSPGKGADLLGKVLMLHSIPNDVFYADSVHHVTKHETPTEVKGETFTIDADSAYKLLSGGDDDGDDKPPHGSSNVTRYVFDSVLPKIHSGKNHTTPPPDKARKFEKVYVDVYRYYLLPGSKGPLQTRVTVQGVAVLIQDVVNLNGATHLITRFIKPEGHPHKGIWAEIAEEAEKAGFGAVDLVEEARLNRW
ncbi:hypothetical protein BCV69DRAFT_280153 [Microstroma glucosiphilum]|uniref:FAS1 domain-containing protein n=1 Tax=Pseudomicrostroma glucosiphilum TaxID=1684307 RepID=A0A316UJW7_9BASI|nr:hypothetical protein BCV69DRAFT_280153 [Pseudomicrostroma glucosiphilum]PWN24263.1 hypothetical protein BCV69DRAFT_280153 [Pseudomicrostroma glucosiphilum]